MTPRRAYMDLTSFYYEVGQTDVDLYATPEDLAQACGCLDECGVAEVSVVLERVVQPGRDSCAAGEAEATPAEKDAMLDRAKQSVIAHMEARIARLQAKLAELKAG